ncbi:hypothetical protein QR680_004906 [Steinernema hermaphroditum]|uniref:Uncharacterized protein n=1 Tax=Steinernema hermaphroditum TaxID=289476 RepID=A0AA39HSI2_9BILA|nr:hypothetical protein QR680_004906 [Steinernema hermaphroditum]
MFDSADAGYDEPPVLQPEEPSSQPPVPVVRVCVPSRKLYQNRQQEQMFFGPVDPQYHFQQPVAFQGGFPVMQQMQREVNVVRVCIPNAQPIYQQQHYELQQRYGGATPVDISEGSVFVPPGMQVICPMTQQGRRRLVKRPPPPPTPLGFDHVPEAWRRHYRRGLVPMENDRPISAKRRKKQPPKQDNPVKEHVDEAQRAKEEQEMLQQKMAELQSEVYRRRQLIIMEVYRRSGSDYNYEKSMTEQLQ